MVRIRVLFNHNCTLNYYYILYSKIRYHKAFIEAANFYCSSNLNDETIINMIDYFAETFKSERTNGDKGVMKRFLIKNKKVEEKINKKLKFFATNIKNLEHSKEYECFQEGILVKNIYKK
jgi:hypothetical protein